MDFDVRFTFIQFLSQEVVVYIISLLLEIANSPEMRMIKLLDSVMPTIFHVSVYII